MPISKEIITEIENNYNTITKNFDNYNYALQYIKKYGGSKEKTKSESDAATR